MLALVVRFALAGCDAQILVNTTSPHIHSVWLSPRQLLCINVTRPYAVVVFDRIHSATVSIFWKVNRRLLPVSHFSDADNLGVLDFSDQIGNLEITVNRSQNLSLGILAFPRSCGPHRYVSDNTNSVIGLSSTLSRANFVANSELFCFWVFADHPFSYRIYPLTAAWLFRLSRCSDEDHCHAPGRNSWRWTDSRRFFEVESLYPLYPSAFSVQLRSGALPLNSSITALVTEENFTHYERVALPSDGRSDRARKKLGASLLAVLMVTVVIVGVLIVWFSISCEEEVQVPEDDPQSRLSLIAHRVQPDGIPEIVGHIAVPQYEYPTALA
jgi:hypothetical protein